MAVNHITFAFPALLQVFNADQGAQRLACDFIEDTCDRTIIMPCALQQILQLGGYAPVIAIRIAGDDGIGCYWSHIVLGIRDFRYLG